MHLTTYLPTMKCNFPEEQTENMAILVVVVVFCCFLLGVTWKSCLGGKNVLFCILYFMRFFSSAKGKLSSDLVY